MVGSYGERDILPRGLQLFLGPNACQTATGQGLIALVKRGDVVADPYAHIPVSEVTVDRGHFHKNGAVHAPAGLQPDFRETLGAHNRFGLAADVDSGAREGELRGI